MPILLGVLPPLRRDPHLWVTVLGLVLYATVAALLISIGYPIRASSRDMAATSSAGTSERFEPGPVLFRSECAGRAAPARAGVVLWRLPRECGMQGETWEEAPMTNLRRLLRVALFVVAAAASIAAALQLREQRTTVARTAQEIEDQLNALDPVTRAAVIARLGAGATQEIKSRVRHHPD